MAYITENSIELVQNPFGNYAIQTVMENWEASICETMFTKLRAKVAQLSIQKFSSNVIEKCLERSDPKNLSLFIEEISNMDKLAGLMKNSYGNYVVQKAITIAQTKDKQMLAQQIFYNIPHLTDKRLRAKWTLLLQKSIKNDPKVYIEGLDEAAAQICLGVDGTPEAPDLKMPNQFAYAVPMGIPMPVF